MIILVKEDLMLFLSLVPSVIYRTESLKSRILQVFLTDPEAEFSRNIVCHLAGLPLSYGALVDTLQQQGILKSRWARPYPWQAERGPRLYRIIPGAIERARNEFECLSSL